MYSFEKQKIDAEIFEKIRRWAKERNLDKADPKIQSLKLMEEFGELVSGHLKKEQEKMIDSIGDMFVVLTILLQQNDLKIEEYFDISLEKWIVDEEVTTLGKINLNIANIFALCKQKEALKKLSSQLIENLKYFSYLKNFKVGDCINAAYQEIKERKGKMLDGCFVKEEDLRESNFIEKTFKDFRNKIIYANDKNQENLKKCLERIAESLNKHFNEAAKEAEAAEEMEEMEEDPQDKDIVYISGQITGISNYKEIFEKAKTNLEAEGYKVINPAGLDEVLGEEFSYSEYLKICLKLLELADYIYFLEDWEESKGANCEFGYAFARGIRILNEDI